MIDVYLITLGKAFESFIRYGTMVAVLAGIAMVLYFVGGWIVDRLK